MLAMGFDHILHGHGPACLACRVQVHDAAGSRSYCTLHVFEQHSASNPMRSVHYSSPHAKPRLHTRQLTLPDMLMCQIVSTLTLLQTMMVPLHNAPRSKPSPVARPPLLCVHGSYHGAWCWAERFMPYFAARGYDVYAVSLRAQVSTGLGVMQ